MLGGRRKQSEMNAFEKIRLSYSSKLKQWIKHIQACVIDGPATSQPAVYSDSMSHLLENMDDDDDEYLVRRSTGRGEGNVGIIMKTLRNDVLDIIEDIEGQRRPSWIVHKLDTLEKNIRETFYLQQSEMKHPVIREEILKSHEKFIVNLIEEIMDDVFQAWNKMKKRKKLGKERSINSVVSVLRMLKKEVCGMLRILKMVELPYQNNLILGMKSKSFNECVFEPPQPSLWKENIKFHSSVTNEINVFESKSFPFYSKEKQPSVHKNVRFEKPIVDYNETKRNDLQVNTKQLELERQKSRQVFLTKENKHQAPEMETGVLMGLQDQYQNAVSEYKLAESGYSEYQISESEYHSTNDIYQIAGRKQMEHKNDACVYTQYMQETKSILPRFLSRLVPKRTNSGRLSGSISNIGSTEKITIEQPKTKPPESSDASTLTEEMQIEPLINIPQRVESGCNTAPSNRKQRDSACNTSSVFQNDIDSGLTTIPSSKFTNFSNKLYCNRKSWASSLNQGKREKIIPSHSSIKQCESVPAIEFIRKQVSPTTTKSRILQDLKLQHESKKELQNSMRDVESSMLADYSTDSDSDESYFSCIPSEMDFNFNSFLNKLKLNDMNKKLETSAFSCKSPKLGELERNKRKTQLRSTNIDSTNHEMPSTNDIEFCTIAFLDENPEKLFSSLTPDISDFSFSPHVSTVDDNARDKNQRNNHVQPITESKEHIPGYNYILDSQFSSLCLSSNSCENLDSLLKHNQDEELVDAG